MSDGTEFASFLDTHRFPSWAEYLQRMAQDEWGDHIILSAAANWSQCNIRVISSVSSHDVTISPFHPNSDADVLVLGHVVELHYVSLRCPTSETSTAQAQALAAINLRGQGPSASLETEDQRSLRDCGEAVAKLLIMGFLSQTVHNYVLEAVVKLFIMELEFLTQAVHSYVRFNSCSEETSTAQTQAIAAINLPEQGPSASLETGDQRSLRECGGKINSTLETKQLLRFGGRYDPFAHELRVVRADSCGSSVPRVFDFRLDGDGQIIPDRLCGLKLYADVKYLPPSVRPRPDRLWKLQRVITHDYMEKYNVEIKRVGETGLYLLRPTKPVTPETFRQTLRCLPWVKMY